MPTKSHEQVIQSFINVHGDRYDYSLVEYTKSSDKVIIVCKKLWKKDIILQKRCLTIMK